MTSLNKWEVKITTPNGAAGHFVMDAGGPPHKIVDFFAEHVAALMEADVDPIPGSPGVAPATQPSRKP